MKVEIWTEAAQFPEKEYINGIFIAVWLPSGLRTRGPGLPQWWASSCFEISMTNPSGFTTVLLHKGGFFNTCTMKRCLHRKVDFKANALNNVHVSQLLHYKAGLLQIDGIIIYLQIKTN